MADVPEQTAPDVLPTQLQAPSVNRLLYRSIGAGGEELEHFGQTLARTGQMGAEDVLRQQAVVNEAAVKDADAKLTDAITDVMHDPKNGYMTQLGKNAIDGYSGVVDRLRALPEGFTDGLKNPRQQEMFKQAAAGRINAAIQGAAVHAGQQTQRYELDSSLARADSASTAIVNGYNPAPGADQSLFQHNVDTLKAELSHAAEVQGLDGPAKDQFIGNAMSKTYTGLIDHLVSNHQNQAAQDVFAKVKDQMDPAHADKIKGILDQASAKDKGLDLAIDLKSKVSGIDAQEKELDRQFKAGKIDEATHQQALGHLRSDNAQRRAEEGEQDKAVLGQVWDLKNKNPNATVADLTPQQLAYVKQRGLGTHIDAILKQDNAMDDSKAYTTLLRQSAEDPRSFGQIDLSKESGHLTQAHFNHLAEIQRAALSADNKKYDEFKVERDAVTSVMGELNAAGLSRTNKPGTSGAQEYAQFETSLHDTIRATNTARASAGKGPMNAEEARQAALGLLKDTALSGRHWWQSSTGPAYKAQPIERIPDNDRQRITQTLVKAGRQATPDEIVRYYTTEQALR